MMLSLRKLKPMIPLPASSSEALSLQTFLRSGGRKSGSRETLLCPLLLVCSTRHMVCGKELESHSMGKWPNNID